MTKENNNSIVEEANKEISQAPVEGNSQTEVAFSLDHLKVERESLQQALLQQQSSLEQTTAVIHRLSGAISFIDSLVETYSFPPSTNS